jgi:UDP-glucose 4-epimerase
MFQAIEAPISSSSAQSAEEEKGLAVQEAYKLPAEFYHFYYGSQTDLGALIEVLKNHQVIFSSTLWMCQLY